MNVPLRAEREIVRAGLSGERWHRHHHRHGQQQQSQHHVGLVSGGVAVTSASVARNNVQVLDQGVAAVASGGGGFAGGIVEETLVTSNINQQQQQRVSSFGVDEEESVHAFSLGCDNSKHPSASTSAGATMGGGGGGMRWWDKLILKDKRFFSAANQQAQRRERLEMEERELERPDSSTLAISTLDSNGRYGGGVGIDGVGVTVGAGAASGGGGTGINVPSASGGIVPTTEAPYGCNKGIIVTTPVAPAMAAATTTTAAGGVPGRRLDGRDAVTLAIPEEFRCRPPRTVARQAAVREWEIRIAWHGVDAHLHHYHNHHHHRYHHGNHANTTARKALLDGRVFFSAKKSYPVAVFSTIKYEPQKEEAARRRKKLEELGGGGTQFVLPERDWSEWIEHFLLACFVFAWSLWNISALVHDFDSTHIL